MSIRSPEQCSWTWKSIEAVALLTMEDSVADDRLSEFLKTGLYRLENSNTIFMDPVRVLNRYYSRFRVSPSAYYTRFFQFREANNKPFENSTAKRKRKRQRKPQTLNQREEIANQRHQVRPDPLVIAPSPYGFGALLFFGWKN